MIRPRYVTHGIYRDSSYGWSHPLHIPRVSACTDLLRALGWLADGDVVESPRAGSSDLTRFHDPAYVAALRRAEADQAVPPEVAARHAIGIQGNPIYPEIFRRPATAAGGTLKAADLVAGPAGGIVHHPAGGTHHGRRDRASGFCYLNDPVLGLLRLLDHGLAPLLYVDLDAHHGDGVQDAFHDDARVFTVSIHEENRWPRTGAFEDRAGGAALNLPVPRGLTDDELALLLDEVVLPLAARLRPATIMVQGGCDGLSDDPQARLDLSNGGLWRAVAALRDAALSAPVPRLIVLGGGGYNPYAVARCWAGYWGLLTNRAVPDRLPPEAEAVLRGLPWSHRRARTPPERWFTTLADPVTGGAPREDVRELARAGRRRVAGLAP